MVASRHGGPGAEDAPDIESGSVPDPGIPTRFPSRSGDEGSATDRTHETPPSRDPTNYALTDHFHERLAQSGRYVSVQTVSEAIRRGQLRWNTRDGWRFALVEDGVRFVVVVGDTETKSPVVVTAWTEIADWNAAMEADRWTPTDVHTIQLRADLSETPDERIPERIRPRAIDRAFEVGHHRVTSEPGARYLQCSDCDGRFRSKGELTRAHCRR